MRSDQIKKGVERAPNRSLLYALGYTEEELNRPLVGVVSSWNEIVPGHMDLDKIVEAGQGRHPGGGGTPVTFPAIAVCDGHCHGPCGDEVFPGHPGPHCRLHRGHGDRPPV